MPIILRSSGGAPVADKTHPVDSTGAALSPDAAALSDALANPTAGLVGAAGLVFNGTTWERVRGISEVTHLASASRTTTQTGADVANVGYKGIKVVLDMTVVGTGSVTLAIQMKDAVSGKYVTILTGAAVITNVTNVYTVYPGITAAANVSASDILPKTFRILVTANNANAATYSVGYTLLP